MISARLVRSFLLALVVAALAIAGASLPASAAGAKPAPVGAYPPGWKVTAAPGGGARLTWVAAQEQPLGDAGVQFVSGGVALGEARPSADQKTFTLDVPALPKDPSQLQVISGGRRLDVAAAPQARRGGAKPTAPALRPGHTFDPGKPGKYATTSGNYTLPSVKLPGLPEPVEMVGHVVAPEQAAGARPLVVFLHGRHVYCYEPGADVTFDWPCAAGSIPVPSQLGYEKAQQLLASQGYDTVSIAANGINAQDGGLTDAGAQARSSLVRLHLGHWADWAGAGRSSAPAIVKAVPRADLSRTLLVGHSRGGEGVNRAALDSLVPPPAAVDGYKGKVRWRIAGTFQLAPTIFGHNPAADVPSVVVLPSCDGDVSDLQGQMTVDRTLGVGRGAALHSAVYVVGADHNFFNSEWTPGLSAAPSEDDWFDDTDAVCGSGAGNLRLTPVQQQQVGATYVAAAAAAFVEGDERAVPLLDGSGVRAPSADPARVLTSALGAGRTTLASPSAGAKASGTGGVSAVVCDQAPGFADDGGTLPGGCLEGGDSWFSSPNFVRFGAVSSEPDRKAVHLKWSAAGSARLKAPAPVSLLGDQQLALRVLVPENSPATKLAVTVVDSSGRTASLGTATLTGLPGTNGVTGLWGQEVRLPLPRGGVDLHKVTEVRLSPSGGTGEAFVLEASGWSPGLRYAPALPVTRVDVADLGSVPEGDTTHTVNVPVTLTANLRGGKFRIWSGDLYGGLPTTRIVTLRPGQTKLDVPFTIKGDKVWTGSSVAYGVAVQAVSGTFAGSYIGTVNVVDDEPAPVATVSAPAAHATEGGALKWHVKLSAPLPFDWTQYGFFEVPETGPELSTLDLTPEFLEGFGVDPATDNPLYYGDTYVAVDVPQGTTEFDITLPTRVDTLTEGDEHLALALDPVDYATQPTLVVTGTVSDK